jgi:transposase
MDAKGVRLTKGYSRDHRPDLNQVILNLITENQAGIPVYMQACSGNTNDSESFKLLVKSHIWAEYFTVRQTLPKVAF